MSSEKPNGNGNSKFLSWKTAAIALATLCMFFFSMWISSGTRDVAEVKAEVKTLRDVELKALRDGKVDLQRYCQDINDIKRMIGEVKESVTRMENLHLKAAGVAKAVEPKGH